MKKVLILSYYFPPCNLTSSNRVWSWAKYLTNYGIFPVIITRNWDIKINSQKDLYQASGEKIIHKKESTYEVFYVPYLQTIRDKILIKYGESKRNALRKAFALIEQITQHFLDFFIPGKNILHFADKFISENKDIKVVIITANPFVLFRFGYKLKKKHNISWIADYRDDWTTTDWKRPGGFINSILFSLERKSEKKWVGTASNIISISDYYVRKIENYTGINGTVVQNGYFEEEFKTESPIESFKIFTITYVGSLYKDQKIEYFIKGFRKFIEKNNIKANIRLLFLGTGFFDDQKQRINQICHDIKRFVEITGWADRQKTIDTILKSHALLLLPAENVTGVPLSKTYEYLAARKPIILCPSDNDIMQQIIQETGTGYICRSFKEINFVLEKLWFHFKKNVTSDLDFKDSKIESYSRKKQTGILADLIYSLLNDNK